MHIKYSRKSIRSLASLHPGWFGCFGRRVDGVWVREAYSHCNFFLVQLTQVTWTPSMATKCPRTVMTHRELTLPPEIVALICAFKPEESHIGQRGWYRGSFYGPWPWYQCCGGSNYKHRPKLPDGRPGRSVNPPCRRFVGGMYHPGKLRNSSSEPQVSWLDRPFVRWSCCGATFGYRDLDAPVGCTPLDLTLRVTTVTRAAPATESDAEQTA